MRTQDLQERVTDVWHCFALWSRSAGFSSFGAWSSFHRRRWDFYFFFSHWLQWKLDQVQGVTLPLIVFLGWERGSRSNNRTHHAPFSSRVFHMTGIFTPRHFCWLLVKYLLKSTVKDQFLLVDLQWKMTNGFLWTFKEWASLNFQWAEIEALESTPMLFTLLYRHVFYPVFNRFSLDLQ